MALSEEQIIDLFNEACRETFNGLERLRYFARAVEAEVRKDDEALMRQLSDALEWLHLGIGPARDPMRAITTARARLGDK